MDEGIDTIRDYILLIKQDIQCLMHLYFRSAYENLFYALNATENNFQRYIEQAKNRFIDAATVEQNENLILSYLGLSICQSILGDYKNSVLSMERIKDVFFKFPDLDIDNLIPDSGLFGRFLGHCICNGIPFSEQLSKEQSRGIELIEKYSRSDIYKEELRRAEEIMTVLRFYQALFDELRKMGGIKYEINCMRDGYNDPLERKLKSAIMSFQSRDFEEFKSVVITSFKGS